MTKKKDDEFWIQGAIKHPGSLRRMLCMPKDKSVTIPKTVLDKIDDADVGDTFDNPTQTGCSEIHVTKKMKQKVRAAQRFRSFH
ncbi:MAG: hypothetical protein WC525_09720 [Candidatus Thermoplasmatota archaeon]